MSTSVLHIKTEIECEIYLFDEGKGVAKPGIFFNLEVRKGVQELLFISVENNTLRYQTEFMVENDDFDYRLFIERSQFQQYSSFFLEEFHLAEQGNVEAQYKLGNYYSKGDGVEKNWEEAIKWYRKAAEHGYASAQYKLGECYYNGNGVKSDWEEAIKWYKKAAEQGNVDAQYNIGLHYSKFVEWCDAIDWFEKAAEQGHSDAQCYMGFCYFNGLGEDRNYIEAAKWYTKSAKQGNSDAQSQLGDCYYNGLGVDKDYKEAVRYYKKAAKQGNTNGQYGLGNCYYFGRGVEINEEKAAKWYKIAAEHGNANAQYELGKCYLWGNGVNEDYELTEYWYKIAAENGHAEAQYSLGEFYFKRKKYELAFGWYKRAAPSYSRLYAKYEVDAQYRLGQCYFEGLGVTKNYEEAVKWFKRAAENGEAYSQLYFADCLYNGWGIIRDRIEAIKWYNKADENIYDHGLSMDIEKIRKNPAYLFFDTETLGLPRNYNSPSSDTDKWPRLVQISWIVVDFNGDKIKSENYIIRPNGFIIPEKNYIIHGISTQKALREGEDLAMVIDKFMNDVDECEILIGHNVSFDKKIVGAELIRMGRIDTLNDKKSFCTMESTKDFCQIQGNNGYKYPKLQELYYKLFGHNFDNVHNSASDVNATFECYWELKRRHII